MKHTLSMMYGLISLFALFLGGFKSVTLQTTDDHILMFLCVAIGTLMMSVGKEIYKEE